MELSADVEWRAIAKSICCAGQYFDVRNATPVLSVGEERDGFTGIFEIVAADKARVGRVKRRNSPHVCRARGATECVANRTLTAAGASPSPR
jgi:hypothetical protein